MIAVRDPRSGAELRVEDEAGAKYWEALGYQRVESAKPAKKATAKRSSKSDSK